MYLFQNVFRYIDVVLSPVRSPQQIPGTYNKHVLIKRAIINRYNGRLHFSVQFSLIYN